jgi:copper oxidase (laccase) domain-containing protein
MKAAGTGKAVQNRGTDIFLNFKGSKQRRLFDGVQKTDDKSKASGMVKVLYDKYVSSTWEIKFYSMRRQTVKSRQNTKRTLLSLEALDGFSNKVWGEKR